MNRFMNAKGLLAVGLMASLAACAAPAEPGRMTVAAGAAPADFPPQLRAALCVGSVTGGETTNPLWVSQVGNAEFTQALDASLGAQGLRATGGCRYRVDANLLGLSQPIAGLDLTVTSHVNYKVGAEGRPPMLQETVTTPFTATFGDSPIAVIRLQRANEGSIKASIATFLQRLRNSQPPTSSTVGM